MSFSPDINLRQFFTVDVIRALPRPIDMTTLTNWTRRPEPAIPLADEDDASARQGRLLLLHFRHAIQIALVSELTGLGLPPRRSGLIASHFTNGGTSRRLPGQLFPEGETFLRAYAGPNLLSPDVRVLNVTHQTSVLSLMRDATYGYTGAILLHINPIIGHLRRELGLPDA